VSDDAPNLGKRSLLATLGLAVAAIIAATVVSLLAPDPPPHARGPSPTPSASAPASAPAPPAEPPPAPDVLALFGDLAASRKMGDLRITRLSGVEEGAIRVEFEPAEGERFRMEIMRRDDKSPPGVAETRSLGIYLVGRQGAQTPEVRARAATELAKVLAASEAGGAAVPMGLLSLEERSARAR
jgi:hypothetical protein